MSVSRTHQLLDVALALAVTAAGLVEIWAPLESRAGEGQAVPTTVVAVLMGLVLTVRRRWPLPVALVVLGAWPLTFLVAPVYVLFFGQFVPMAVALFTTARWGRDRVPFLGAAAGAATLLFFDLAVEALQSPGEIIFHWGVFTLVWLFGFALAHAERRARQSTERAVQAEVAAAEQAMAAVVAERTRIARELHDIVAHSVSSMVVQAGAAEQVVGDDPEQVRRALSQIRSTGAGALTEMRRVVTMLRSEGEVGSLAPQPGLDGVRGLLRDAEGSGLTASLEVRGTPRDLPAGLDLTAYRIVQEALTNVRRHASASSVRVVVAYLEDEIALEVLDDGIGASAPRHPGGHGLVGMRERALLYGGRVEAGPEGSRGFAVRAVLPAMVPA